MNDRRMGIVGQERSSIAAKRLQCEESEVKWNYGTLEKLAFEESKSAQSFESVHALRLMIADDWPVKVSKLKSIWQQLTAMKMVGLHLVRLFARSKEKEDRRSKAYINIASSARQHNCICQQQQQAIEVFDQGSLHTAS